MVAAAVAIIAALRPESSVSSADVDGVREAFLDFDRGDEGFMSFEETTVLVDDHDHNCQLNRELSAPLIVVVLGLSQQTFFRSKNAMSELHAETATVRCSTPHCNCEFPAGTGYSKGDSVYCNEQCANPKVRGCGHSACPCNNLD